MRIWLGNLPYDMHEQWLRMIFAPYHAELSKIEIKCPPRIYADSSEWRAEAIVEVDDRERGLFAMAYIGGAQMGSKRINIKEVP
jgi:hypothetical protein